jgi:hypothetical protein
MRELLPPVRMIAVNSFTIESRLNCYSPMAILITSSARARNRLAQAERFTQVLINSGRSHIVLELSPQ